MGEQARALYAKIKDAETAADASTHDTIQRLHENWITPFDRDDSHSLSTTQTITGAIVGVGTVRKLSAVRWGVAGRVVWAWVFTVPGAAAVSALTYLVLHLLGVPV